MGPLILLSLLGVGAATALVDFSSNDQSAEDDADTRNADQPETDLDDTQTDDGAAEQDEAASDSDVMPPYIDPSNTLYGTDDADVLYARGSENIDGADGDDTLTSFGEGLILGGEGNDVLEIGGDAEGYGGNGEDYMHISEAGIGYGGDGDDTFFLEESKSAEEGPSQAHGGDGDDTFIMQPLSGLPEDTIAHVLTGGAGADIYALDINSAIAVRQGDDADNQIIATITDFDPSEDLLLVDLGAAVNFDDVDSLPVPEVTTTEAADGSYTDVHFSWTNPLNPDNVETRTMRLEGVQNFSAGDVELTSVFDPDSHLNETDTGDAAAHRLFALTPTEGTDGDDDLSLSGDTATVLKDGNDSVDMSDGTHLVYGGDGDDSLEVTQSTDGAAQLFGGEGDDVLTADLSLNNDTALTGGAGDDTLTFGMGHYVDAGAGADTMILNVHPSAVHQGPAVVTELTGNHLTLNIPSTLDGDIQIVNHTYSNGFEVAYSEIFVGDVCVLKVMEEDFTTGTGIAEIDPRITIVRDAVL